MNEKDKVIDLIKHRNDKVISEFEQIKEDVIFAIYDDVIPLLGIDNNPILSELSEEEILDLKAMLCGETTGYIMGMLDKKKELICIKYNINRLTNNLNNKDK